MGKAIQYHHVLDVVLFTVHPPNPQLTPCIRGGRSSVGRTAYELLPVDLMSSEAQVSNNFGAGFILFCFFKCCLPLSVSILASNSYSGALLNWFVLQHLLDML